MEKAGKMGGTLREQGLTPGAAALERWRAAMRWHRAICAQLCPLDLSLTRWLVLDAVDEEIHLSGDAVSQREIAERAELDQMTVSRAMSSLEWGGWVSRGPSYLSPAYRVILTAAGKVAVREGRALIEAASERWSAG